MICFNYREKWYVKKYMSEWFVVCQWVSERASEMTDNGFGTVFDFLFYSDSYFIDFHLAAVPQMFKKSDTHSKQFVFWAEFFLRNQSIFYHGRVAKLTFY